MEDAEESYYFSDGAESLDSYDKEQLEIALYSKIHFATNFDQTQDTDAAKECVNVVNDDFDICVEGNENTGYKASETNADYVLNRDMEKKYDSVVTGAHNIKKNHAPLKKIFDTEGIKKSRQVNDEVRESKRIQSLIRKADLADSGIQLDSSKEDIISFDDSKDGTIYIDDTTTGSESDSDIQDIVLGESSSDCLSDVDIKMNVHAPPRPRYTYTKMTGESHLDNNYESDDADHWGINEEDKFKDKGVNVYGRYYKPVRCHNCNEVGHLSKNCPKPKKVIVCALCAEEGHVCRNCPHSFCHNCETPGHESKFCPAPRRRWNRTCYRCYMPGHDEKSCPEIWRQYHITINRGKIKKFSVRRKRKSVSCYNCGDHGHYGHECEDDRMNRFLMVNSPFITRYQKVQEFCDIISPARSDEMVDQSEATGKDREWKSFDNIGEHVRTLRERKGKLVNESGTSKGTDKERKKPSQYLHMVKKTGKLRTGRNNFDKMLFTNKNEKSGEISNTRKRFEGTEKEKRSIKGEKTVSKQSSKTCDSKNHVKTRKRKADVGDDNNSVSSSKLNKDFSRKIRSDTTSNKTRQADVSKRTRKEDTFPTSGKESGMPKYNREKSKRCASNEIPRMRDARPEVKARTVSFNQNGTDMVITANKTVKTSKSSVRDHAEKGNKKKNKKSKFSADDLFSLMSIDTSDSRSRDVQRNEPMVKISKKHKSHRNDSYAPDDLFSLQKLNKMQDGGEVGDPVEVDDVNHQVFNNEWWNKGKKKRRRKRRKNEKY